MPFFKRVGGKISAWWAARRAARLKRSLSKSMTEAERDAAMIAFGGFTGKGGLTAGIKTTAFEKQERERQNQAGEMSLAERSLVLSKARQAARKTVDKIDVSLTRMERHQAMLDASWLSSTKAEIEATLKSLSSTREPEEEDIRLKEHFAALLSRINALLGRK